MSAERWERLDPHPSQHRVELDESVIAIYDNYLEAERRAARISATVAEWIDQSSARLARRMRRAFRITR